MGLTFPITADGLEVDVLVNVSPVRLIPMWQAGVRPSPIATRGLIDTACDVTSVSPAVLGRLGLSSSVSAKTQGVGGSVSSGMYLVTLSILDAAAPSLPWLVYPGLPVLSLPPAIPFDVLIGLDVIRTLRMNVDGPTGYFTLDS